MVDKNGDYEGLSPNKNGEILIYPQGFGWSFITYSDPESKLAYLLIYIRDWVDNETTKLAYHEKLRAMVEAHTGAAVVRLRDENEGVDDYGYIDHQSVEDGQLEEYFADEQLMKDFIFGQGSYVETGNDNV